MLELVSGDSVGSAAGVLSCVDGSFLPKKTDFKTRSHLSNNENTPGRAFQVVHMLERDIGLGYERNRASAAQ